MTVIAEVDGDIIAYRVAAICQIESWHILDEDGEILETFSTKLRAEKAAEGRTVERTLEVQPLANALHSVKVMLSKIKEATGADKLRIHLSASKNWRDKLCTIAPYKANRWSKSRLEAERDGPWASWISVNENKVAQKDRPVLLPKIQEYLIKHHSAVKYDDLEADDGMGIRAWRRREKGQDYVIATIDKDLNMIPGVHYDFVNDKLFEVEQDVADHLFFHQMLTGDGTDNIEGIFGCGEKIADSLLEGCKTVTDYLHRCFSAYYRYYEGRLPGESEGEIREAAWGHMNEVGGLVWILRRPDEMWWNHFEKDVKAFKMWEAAIHEDIILTPKGRLKVVQDKSD